MTDANPTATPVTLATTAVPGDVQNMTADQITTGLRDNSISGFQRGDALTRLASLLKGETPAAEQKLSIQQMPTAADQSEAEAAAAIAANSPAAAAYAPAKSPADYTVPISHTATEMEQNADIDFREALHAAELPVITANAVAAAMDHADTSLRHSDTQQLQAFAQGQAQGLQQLWGADFAAKVQAVDAFLDSAAERIPLVRTLLEHPRFKFYFSDRRVVAALSQMIENRNR